MNSDAPSPDRGPAFDSRAEIDYLLAGLPEQKVSIVTLYQALVRAEVDVIVRVSEGPGGRQEGLVLNDLAYGRLVALFTEPGLAERWRGKLTSAPHQVLRRLGGEVIAVLAPDVGLWLNPEGRRGCRIAAAALRRLREDFGVHLPTPAGEGAVPSTLPPGHA